MTSTHEPDPDDLGLRQRIRAVGQVARLAFTVAPLAVVLSIIAMILDAVLPLATAWFAAQTTTALADAIGGDEGARSAVFAYIAATATLGLLHVAWMSVHGYISAKLTFLIDCRITDGLLEHYAALEMWRYDDVRTADLYDRASRFAASFSRAFDKVTMVGSSLTTTVAATAGLVVVHPLLALAVLVAVLPGLLVQFRLSRRLLQHWNDAVGVRRTRIGIERGMMHPRAIVEVRSLGLIRHLMGWRHRLRATDEQARVHMERDALRWRFLADILEALVVAGSLIWVTLQIVARTQPIGQFLFVQQVVSRAIEGANELVTAIADVDQDVANLFDYTRFLAIPRAPEAPDRLAVAPQVIEVRDVSFAYPGAGRPTVLHDIDLTIRRGQHVAIVGENGAGKSSFVKLLLGQYQPSTGTIRVDGHDLADLDIASWHAQLGYLRQEFARFPFATVRDNVRFGAVERSDDADERVWAALTAAQADAFVRDLPSGLDTVIDPWLSDEMDGQGVDLSGGQWQRLALARMFYRDPQILLLDEPTSALDALAEERVFAHIFERWRDRTVISVSHRLSTIRPADVIHVLRDGRLVETGSHDELLAARGHYYRMFARQLM